MAEGLYCKSNLFLVLTLYIAARHVRLKQRVLTTGISA